MSQHDESVLDEFPPIIDPEMRALARQLKQDHRRREYWQRVEAAARELWARGNWKCLSMLVTNARDFIDEIDRQRAAEGVKDEV